MHPYIRIIKTQNQRLKVNLSVISVMYMRDLRNSDSNEEVFCLSDVNDDTTCYAITYRVRRCSSHKDHDP